MIILISLYKIFNKGKLHNTSMIILMEEGKQPEQVETDKFEDKYN